MWSIAAFGCLEHETLLNNFENLLTINNSVNGKAYLIRNMANYNDLLLLIQQFRHLVMLVYIFN
jgi:hypothetical protein